MTESQFNQLAAEGYNRIPLVLETFADLDTPLSVYLKLAYQPYTYLLESVVGGERFGRYSFIGLAATSRIEVRGHECSEFECGTLKSRAHFDDPLAFIQQYQARFKAAAQPGLPRFCGGLVGYFGYDTIRYIEKRLRAGNKPDPLDVPDVVLLLSEQLAVVDNLSGKIYLVVYVDPGRPAGCAAVGALRVWRSAVFSGGRSRQALHFRRRHHAGGAVAAHESAVQRISTDALSRIARIESVAVYVFLQLRRFSCGRRVA